MDTFGPTTCEPITDGRVGFKLSNSLGLGYGGHSFDDDATTAGNIHPRNICLWATYDTAGSFEYTPTGESFAVTAGSAEYTHWLGRQDLGCPSKSTGEELKTSGSQWSSLVVGNSCIGDNDLDAAWVEMTCIFPSYATPPDLPPDFHDWSNQFATCTTYNGNSCSKCLKPCANQPERLCCYNPVEEADCSCLENHKWCGDVTLTCSTTQKPTDGNEVNIDNFGETTNAHSSVMSTTYSSHVWDMIVGYPGETLSVNLVYMQVGTGGSIDGIWTIGTSYTATSVSGIQCSEIETTSEIVNGHAGYNWLKCDFQGQSITVPSDGVLYSKIQITGGSNQREDTGSQAHTSFHYQNGGFRAGFTSFYFTSINLGGYVDVPSCEWHEMNNMNKVIQTEQFFGFECPANQIISHIRLQGYDENSHLENNPRAILCCGLRGSSEVTDRCEDSYSTADGILEAATCEGNNAMVALYDLADPTLQELQWEYQATKGITCCDIEYNTDYGHTLDLGIDRNQCEIVSHSSPVGIFDVACPDDMVLVEIRDNDPARGVQEVHEIECCRVHNALAPTHAPTISPSTSEPSPAPTTSCHDCLIGVHGRQVSAQDAFVSEVEACLSHCCA